MKWIFFPEGLQPMEERTHTGAGEKCEEEAGAEMNCYELTPNPRFPCLHTTQQGEKVEGSGMKERS